jgi:hypothetical protein
MRKLTLTLTLLSLIAGCGAVVWGQAAPAVVPTTTTTLSTPTTLIGAYISGVASTHPQPTGGSFIAVRTPLASGGIWSITGNDYSVTPQHTVQSASWTGIASPVQVLGHTVYGCLGGGGTAPNVGYVVTFCGVLAVPIKGGKWGQLLVSPMVSRSNAGGTQEFIRIGWGVLKQ